MAELVIDNDCLHVKPSALERVDAIHGDFTVPIIPDPSSVFEPLSQTHATLP